MEKNIVKIAETDLEIEGCFDVMSELRTELKRNEFLQTVRAMESDGFRLAYMKDEGEVVVVAGYRIYTNLLMGSNLYIDDLVTSASARSRGFGEIMLKWLREKAREAGCRFFRLDSGTTRDQAHKFYFNQGFTIAAFAFCELLHESSTAS